MDGGTEWVVGALNGGRSRKFVTHEGLIHLFFRFEYSCVMTLKWAPTAANHVADAIPRPTRDTVMQLVRQRLGGCGACSVS